MRGGIGTANAAGCLGVTACDATEWAKEPTTQASLPGHRACRAGHDLAGARSAVHAMPLQRGLDSAWVPRGAQVTAYAVESVQQRGRLFVEPGQDIYESQVVGIHQRQGDLKARAPASRLHVSDALRRVYGWCRKEGVYPPPVVVVETLIAMNLSGWRRAVSSQRDARAPGRR